jgi:hypothetical protein
LKSSRVLRCFEELSACDPIALRLISPQRLCAAEALRLAKSCSIAGASLSRLNVEKFALKSTGARRHGRSTFKRGHIWCGPTRPLSASHAPFISISNNQRRPLTEANWLGTVYHGLPAASLRPSFTPGPYLAFFGRITAEKGPEVAIRIAQATGLPLRIAAKLPRGERRYFNERLEPLIEREHPAYGRGQRAAQGEVSGKCRGLAVSDRLARTVRPGHD